MRLKTANYRTESREIFESIKEKLNNIKFCFKARKISM